MATPNVCFVRPELSTLLPQYYLIRDCLSGEPTVKAAGTKYLPMPNPTDTSPENLERYKAYKQRAVFYNVMRRTLHGLTGQVFMRDPQIKVSSMLEPVIEDATGSGVNIIQLAKKGIGFTLSYSRCGLLVDYPKTEQEVSIEQLQTGEVRPNISIYTPFEIINWRVETIGSKDLLTLVVLCESYVSQDDGFEIENSAQFRVLRLNEEGNYEYEIYRETTPKSYDGTKIPKGNYKLHEGPYTVFGFNGEPLKEIPFTFIGSENNDSNCDNPNMYDLASLNIAHYRNSADYEEACFIVGQPTLVPSGLTEDWVNNVLKGVVAFGSRGGIPMPVGGKVELLQAKENTMIKEAMDTKERQMVALGAKLVEQKSVQRTAFETKVESTSEGSILSSTTKNVSSAFLWALQKCAMFIGQDESSIEFELNTDFDLANITPEEQARTIANWQAGALSFKEMRDQLRRAGSATEEDEVVLDEVQKKKEEELRMQQALKPVVQPK